MEPPSPAHGVISKDLSFRVREKGGLMRHNSGKGSEIREIRRSQISPELDPAKRFSGHWQSENGDNLDGFLSELGLSAKFKRLSSRFTESTVSTLVIDQDGEFFSITDSNEMRDVLQVFVVGTPFESESERGELIHVDVTWEGDALVYHAKPLSDTGKRYIVRRWIEGEHMIQTHCVEGSSTLAKRVFARLE
ncbi:hypothetical protein BASA81_008445 [Batrachochytrium salamandrivorans]|nr:hypothetical protein BASA81_008445 [Batrachochytrium salamandrivorans]